MTRMLIVHEAGPNMSLQDMGRSGYLAFGLSRGGAMDRLALAEGAALLGQSADLAVIEMAGMGGTFEVTEETRIALTGAPMRADLDGQALAWNASHLLPHGARLRIGPVTSGSYGYLHLGGGICGDERLGARSAHLAAGLGATLDRGERLQIGPDSGTRTGMKIAPRDRFGGGAVRVVASLQTDFFPQDQLERFETAPFTRDTRANRMGVRCLPEGEGFGVPGGLNVLSEVIVPGDIQVTGDGAPFVLMAECQTTGGYPRIATVLPADMPIVAQAPAGAPLRFRFVTLEEAAEAERKYRSDVKGLGRTLEPLVRHPGDIPDLLGYQLVSGMVNATDPDIP